MQSISCWSWHFQAISSRKCRMHTPGRTEPNPRTNHPVHHFCLNKMCHIVQCCAMLFVSLGRPGRPSRRNSSGNGISAGKTVKPQASQPAEMAAVAPADAWGVCSRSVASSTCERRTIHSSFVNNPRKQRQQCKFSWTCLECLRA